MRSTGRTAHSCARKSGSRSESLLSRDLVIQTIAIQTCICDPRPLAAPSADLPARAGGNQIHFISLAPPDIDFPRQRHPDVLLGTKTSHFIEQFFASIL